jgi:YVTN family beta-propeller protein
MGSRFIRSLVVALCLAAPGTAAAQNFVYAIDSGIRPQVMCSANPSWCHAPIIHLINAATGHDLWTITLPASSAATSLRLSSDGRTLFATAGGQLFVIDALARRIVGQVIVGAFAVDVAVLPDNSRAYVVGGSNVVVVDLSSLTVVATIPMTGTSVRIIASPTGNAVYVANSGSSSVDKISTTTNAIETTIGVGPSPSGLDLSPDGSRLFVASSGNQTVTVIDATLDSVLRVLPAGSSSAPPFDVSAQSPTRIFVTLSLDNGTGNAVQLLNAADGAILGSTPIGTRGRLARDSSGTPTYVADTGRVRRVADIGTATSTLAGAIFWNGAAVLTDPCAFESTASVGVFGPAGGSGTLTIPAPAGCGWTLDTTGAAAFAFSGPLSGSGPATVTYTSSASSAPKLGTIAIGRQVITLEQTIPRMVIDFPTGDTPVLQQPFTVGGWAIDQNLGERVLTPSGFRARGVTFLHVWAYPASGAPIFLGTAGTGYPRPDVASFFGSNLTNCGFNFTVNTLASGTYTLVAFAHSEISDQFIASAAVRVTVVRTPPVMVVDTPKPSSTISGAFDVGGWATDPAAADFTGSGVDAVHVWAYPLSGAPPIFVGAATRTLRPDVSQFFHESDFYESGFLLRGAVLPAGTYDLVVFARSTVDRTFNNSSVVRITVR